MRVECARTFRDRRTGALVKRGAVVDVEPDRAAELVEAGVCMPLEPLPAKAAKEPEKAPKRAKRPEKAH